MRMSATSEDTVEDARKKIQHASHCEPEEVMELYTEWAINNKYDEHVTPTYNGATVCADGLKRHVQDNTDITILDVAAGTGLIGGELKKLGFKKIDALDPVRAMLEVAKQKRIYRNYYEEYFDGNVKCLETDSYDALITSGSFVQGHMKCEALQEMVRCTKPGGFIVIAMREESLHDVEELKDRFEPEIKRLEQEGKLEIIERKIFPQYVENVDGILFVFKAK